MTARDEGAGEWPTDAQVDSACAALKASEHKAPGYWADTKDNAWKASWRRHMRAALLAAAPQPPAAGEADASAKDLYTHGTSVMKDGKRVDPRELYQRPPDGYLYAYDGYFGRRWQLDAAPYNGRNTPDETKPYWFAAPPAPAAEEARDAKRYRWLMAQKHADIAACWFLPLEATAASPHDIGAAIDAAIAASEEAGK